MNETEIDYSCVDVLIVDDTPANLQVLATMLKKLGIKVRPLPSGRFALQAAQAAPPDLILLDIMMPDMNGYEVCRRLKEHESLKDIPVIFLSALAETRDKVEAFRAGGVDYIVKPFQFEEVMARVETHLKLRRLRLELARRNQHLEELVREQVREISDSQMTTIFALARLAESRDNDTGKHLERVQVFCRLLAARLGEQGPYQAGITAEFIENIFHASPLHDIGKVGIPDNILLKPGKLSQDEFEIMKTHTNLGAETLEAVRSKYPRNAFVNMGIAIARSHHERWDGSGYPDGLKEDSIPLGARIMAVADVYDALRSKRCYKQAFSHEKSCEIIFSGSGTHFDPRIVEAFRELMGQFKEVWNIKAD